MLNCQINASFVFVRFSQFGFPILGRASITRPVFHICYCTRGFQYSSSIKNSSYRHLDLVYCVPSLVFLAGIPLVKHKRLTGVGRTNHVQKGQTQQEMPDEAPNTINTSQAIGKVTKFVVGADWESYTEQLDFYFLANGVKEPKTKRAVLLTNLPVELTN